MSPSGTLIASGQVGTKNFKGNAAPIFLWHASSCRRLLVLRGLSGSATFSAFSTDERFMCGADEVRTLRSFLYLFLICSLSRME